MVEQEARLHVLGQLALGDEEDLPAAPGTATQGEGGMEVQSAVFL